MGDKIKYLRGMLAWVGFRTSRVEYDRPERPPGRREFGLIKLVHFAVEGVISFSKAPLRLCYLLSILATISFLLYRFFVLVLPVFGLSPLVPGWTSLLLCIVVFGSPSLFAIGILGEYLTKVFETVKQRPDFIVREVAGSRK